ncbi:hypothetical protein T08_6502, partial [Trichinella sp. T8]
LTKHSSCNCCITMIKKYLLHFEMISPNKTGKLFFILNLLHHGCVRYLALVPHMLCQNMIIVNYPGQQPRSIN